MATRMERTGRAGSIVLLLVPFRDGGNVLGYPLGYSLDGFVVEVAFVAACLRRFWGSWVAVEDTYIQRGEGTAFGGKAQLKVDGSPESVALIKFDVSFLNGIPNNEPDQILCAVLRLYSMTRSDLGGVVSITQEPIERMQVYQGSAGASLHQRTAH